MKNLTYANILEGQITLDRAIKHLANRVGTVNTDGQVIVLPSLETPNELGVVMLLEAKWDELESARIQKIRASRLKKKAGEA